MFGIGKKDFYSYIGAMIYGFVENSRALGFHPPEGSGTNVFGTETVARATEGIRGMFDQNMGDGTIVSLGFIGADVLLIMANNISKKLGKKGIDPTVRFLSSLTFGVALASYLETTEIMNNTVDIPGDLFGVALGAAFILTSKIASDRLTAENIEKVFKKTKEITSAKLEKLKSFGDKLGGKLKEMKKIDKPVVEDLSGEFLALIEETSQPENNLNP